MSEQPSEAPRGNARGAWIFVVVVVVVAVLVAGAFLVLGGTSPGCEDWESAKTEWVSGFPPIQQQSKADLADFQGWVEVDGQRVERPDGC